MPLVAVVEPVELQVEQAQISSIYKTSGLQTEQSVCFFSQLFDEHCTGTG
jgi:hypothetical protein